MSDEKGWKWWIRYVVVPLIGSGGLIALFLAYMQQPTKPLPDNIEPPSIEPVITREALEKCVNEQKLKMQRPESFTSTIGEVNCEGAGSSGAGRYEKGLLSYIAPPGYEVYGSAIVNELSRNNGKSGAIEYIKDSEGRVTKVQAPISCSSPSTPFGPGASMKARIEGEIRRILTDNNINELRSECKRKLSMPNQTN